MPLAGLIHARPLPAASPGLQTLQEAVVRAAGAVVAAIDQAALAIFLAQKCAEEGPGAAQRKKGGWRSAPAVPVRGAWWHTHGLSRPAAALGGTPARELVRKCCRCPPF